MYLITLSGSADVDDVTEVFENLVRVLRSIGIEGSTDVTGHLEAFGVVIDAGTVPDMTEPEDSEDE